MNTSSPTLASEQTTRSPHGADVAHTAPRGAITTARELGVQYRTDCGIWRWPTRRVRNLRTVADLRPNTCPLCLVVVLVQTGRKP